jgi:hypothetical protein
MAILQSQIETALNELIFNEEGMRFQRIAVVLAKQKWPELIASELKKDLGRDAYAPAILATDAKGRALASSLTADIGKIKDDLEKIRQAVSALAILIFYTPRKVTEEAKERWVTTIRRDYSVELVVVSREDVIADLMSPNNASICRSLLRIPLAYEQELADVIERTRTAISDVNASWLRASRFTGRPIIEPSGVRLDDQGLETRTLITIAELEAVLFENQRVIIEGPAGIGKTTTLVLLADRADGADAGHLTFLVNLPEFLSSRDSILDFIAKMPAFLSRLISAADLAKVYQNIHCSFLLNGWNEIPQARSEDAVNALAQLDRNFPAAGIILATRAHRISPPLAATLRVRLSPLSRAQRTEYVRQLLGEKASDLIVQLERDSALDELTRVPLVLAQVVALFRARKPIPRTKMAVLAAIVALIEGSDEHRDHLRSAPLAGNATEYLAEFAKRATDQSEVIVNEASARTAVHSVSNRLRSGSQIASLPEPADILSLLCAHHVLEAIEYPSVAFRFQHQQFEEFYAAVALRRELSALPANRDPSAHSEFTHKFINQPAWEESLRMLAEEIGQAIVPQAGDQNLEAAKRLITLTIGVDPIFAADLSRLGGDTLWQEVRGTVSDRLRSWRADADDHHKQCALAGMLACGAPDFSDVLIPLLSDRDQQVRLKTYRAWHEFHVSSLGADWSAMVRAWDEDHRRDFVGELGRQRQATPIVEQFAVGDQSQEVRVTAVQALFFAGAPESLRRALNALDDASFQAIVRRGMLDRPPSDLRTRVVYAYRAILAATETSLERIGIMLSILNLGETGIQDQIFNEIACIPSASISNDQQWALRYVVERLSKIDRERVSRWAMDGIINGPLYGGHWLAFITSVSEAQRQALFEQLTGRELSPIAMQRLADLAPAADRELCHLLFTEACAVESRLASLPPNVQERPPLAAICRQIQGFLRKAPAPIALGGILAALSSEPNPTEYELLVDTFGSVGDEDFDLRPQLDDGLCRKVRGYLMAGIHWVLSQEDYSGNLKAVVATTLARIGEAEDVKVLTQLIRADIERRRVGLAARATGDRGPIGNGATMSYSNWHVRAVCRLGPELAEALLLKLLNEPEYEQDAARGLLQLARKPAPTAELPIPMKPPDYASIWNSRQATQPFGFDEEIRRRSADGIRETISEIIGSDKAADSNSAFRAKKLAAILAVLDPKDSAEFVFGVIISPGRWDEWDRVSALQALLFGGGRLATRQVLDILKPVIERTTRALHDQQERYLLTQCLCILAYVDEPSIGIARLREIIAATALHGFRLRELFPALGQCRCEDALGLLLDIGGSSGNALQGVGVEWINAIASLSTDEAKKVLLGFADPAIANPRVQYRFEKHEIRELASRIADLARVDTAIRERLFSLCATNLDEARRHLLAEITVLLGTQDSLIAGLNLIRDDATLAVPFEVVRALEPLFLEHRPYGDSSGTYTLEPRDANAIRSRLFEMLLTDDVRRRSAWSLLGQIELWRIEYGRPTGEPRHPQIDSGLTWPPLERYRTAVGTST